MMRFSLLLLSPSLLVDQWLYSDKAVFRRPLQAFNVQHAIGGFQLDVP